MIIIEININFIMLIIITTLTVIIHIIIIINFNFNFIVGRIIHIVNYFGLFIIIIIPFIVTLFIKKCLYLYYLLYFLVW